MRFFQVLLVVATVAGLASGPWALNDAAASNPPLRWQDILLIFAASAASLLLVLGLQSALGNDKAVRLCWYFFLLCAIHFFAIGLSAAGVALASSEVAPHSLLFLSIGAGLLAGVAGSRVLLASKFNKT